MPSKSGSQADFRTTPFLGAWKLVSILGVRFTIDIFSIRRKALHNQRRRSWLGLKLMEMAALERSQGIKQLFINLKENLGEEFGPALHLLYCT